MSEVFHTVLADADFPDDGKIAVEIASWCVLIAKTDGMYHAYNDRCPHAGSLLSTGRMRRGAVMCPLHGARFDLVTGANIGGTYPALRRFPVRVVGGMIEVAVPALQPGVADLPIISG